MTSIDKQQISSVLKTVALITLLILACKLSKGVASAAVVVYGVWAASTNKLGKALSCYVLTPLLVVANPFVAGIGGVGLAILKIGFLVMTFMLMLGAGKRRGREQVPLGLLWLYVFVSIFSSIDGYAPLISFLKLINFSLFLIGIWLGLRNIDKRPLDLMALRSFMLAVAVLIICGSLFLAVAFPGAAYFNSLKEIIDEYGVETINEHGLGQIDRMALLCGITNQSQCLAPLSAVTAIWVLCDLLFVEKRLAVLHLVILVGAMPLVYMTRSRCALLATCAGVTMVVMYGFRFVSLDRQVKRKLISGMLALSSLVAIAVVVVELRDNSISKWIRKTDDVKGDTRTVSEAFTESRQGMVAKNMYDFYRNPLWGSGFQVEYDFQYRYPRDKIVLSAPIEKGVLPLMVLGEAGVAGALVFFCFVVTFYFKCTQRRYVATAILFTVFFASNLGEATFFSTGGSGGICWIMSIVGGFAIDMITLKGARLQRQLAAW